MRSLPTTSAVMHRRGRNKRMLNPCYVNQNPKCGEIWMCRIEKRNGSVQCGYRPVFVLSNDKNNYYSPTLNVIPLTTKMNKRKLPVHVELWDYKAYGLTAPSTMMVEQITTVSADSMDRFLGKVEDKKTLGNIHQAMKIQFPIMAM